MIHNNKDFFIVAKDCFVGIIRRLFLQSIINEHEQAQRASLDTQKILERYEYYRTKLKEGKRVPQEAARILDHVFANPFISISRHAQRVEASYQIVQRGVEFWIEQGLLREATGQRRNRIFIASEIFTIMSSSSFPINANES